LPEFKVVDPGGHFEQHSQCLGGMKSIAHLDEAFPTKALQFGG